jgi:peptide/nickel transport system permease protein
LTATLSGRLAAVAVLAGLAALALAAPVLCPGGPLARVGAPLMGPGAGAFALWLGTDDLGRGTACQIAFGLRSSAAVALGTLGIALGAGVAIGLAAGYGGGLLDAVLSRVVAAFQVLPRFFLAVLVAALFGPSLPLLILVLGATSWTTVARLARAETLSIRRRPYVMAAEALGCAPAAVLWRHVLPNALPPVIAAVPVIVGAAVLAEAALGFIGLGDGSATSLGRLIADAYPFFALAPWMSLAPVAALAALVLAVQGALS